MRINMKEKVEEVLRQKVQARDNDFYLMYWVWKEEFSKSIEHDIEFDRSNIVLILSLLKERKLSHPSGIMRGRRKLQEEHAKLI